MRYEEDEYDDYQDVKSKTKKITLEQRKKIESLIHKNISLKKIAAEVGIHYATIFRELKKCIGPYNAEEAHANTNRPYGLIHWDIIGKRFGLLTVKSLANKYKRRTWWKCDCDCGRNCIISRKTLTEYCSPRRPLSCGCIAKESLGPNGKVPFEEACLRKFQDLIYYREIVGECWEWTGYKQAGKVPKTSWKNKAMTVRKCMYLINNGSTYEPNHVYTNCGNLNCFNPDHLTLNRPPKRIFYKDSQ